MVSNKTAINTDNQVYMKLKNERKSVKIKQGIVPFIKNVILHDIHLKARGPREDEMLAGNPFYRKNIRRGLSFIEAEKGGYTISRRGLEKFFDLKHEYIEILEGADKGSFNLSYQEQRLYNVIFDSVQSALKKGDKVNVYKTEKANGENAQISYLPEYDAWVIASKNVSMLARNPEDVQTYIKYEDERYGFATLIADAWFKILNKLVPDVEALKKELVGKTLVGEYCGNPMYQHLVEYKEITILFYALVDNHGDSTCLPIPVIQDFIERHKLPKVRVNLRKECSNIRDLAEILSELSKEVAQNPLEEDQEGSVIYFEAKGNDKTEVLSLCKLKTLEYRLYRKLREKLKAMISKSLSSGSQIHYYMREVEDLCQKYQPPKPLEHYYEIARIAMRFTSENTQVVRKIGLTQRFLSFLKVIFKCHAEGRNPEEKDFEELLATANELPGSDIGDEGDRDEEAKDEQEEGENKERKHEKKGKNEKKTGSESQEEKRTSKKKKSAEEDEVEEKKTTDAEASKVQQVAEHPKRIVIITPPLYFDWDMRRKILERVGAKELEEEFKDTHGIIGKRSVVLMNRFPKINNKELEKNTVFLIAGFDADDQSSTLKKVESLAVEDRKQFRGTEFTFLQSKDKQKSVQILWDNCKTFLENIHKVLPNNYHSLHLPKPDKILEEIDLALEKLKNFQSNLPVTAEAETGEGTKAQTKKSSEGKNQILVFIPIGIPGMGKTTFLNLLKKLLGEKGCEISIISSDKIRKQHMDSIIKREPKVNKDKAFERAAKPAKKQFFDDVENAIKKTGTLQGSHIIFLDKNHPPNIIQDTIDFFHKPEYKSRYRIKTVILKPFCCSNLQVKSNTYPFSTNFILTCLKRAMNRGEHETLNGDDITIASVLLSFVNLYKNYKANESDFKFLGADFLMELPFTHEDPEVEKTFPEPLVKSMKEVFIGLRGFEPDQEKVIKFLEEFSELQVELKNPDPQLLYQASVDNLNKCFSLFEISKE